MKSSTKALSLAGVFSLIIVALTGCAAPQTQEEACAYLDKEVSAVAEGFKKDLDDASGGKDIKAYVDIQKSMIGKFEAIGNGVTNAKVKSTYTKLVSLMRDTVPIMEKLVENPAAGLGDDFDDLSKRGGEATQELRKVCPNLDMTP